MKYSLVCILVFCLSILASEVDNEIEKNEIDVNEEVEKVNYYDYTTKNPWNPFLVNFPKKANTRNLSQSVYSSDSSDLPVDSLKESTWVRHRRSADIEIKNDMSTTTEEVQKSETEEILEFSSTTTIPPTEETENFIDSVLSSTTLKSKEEQIEDETLTNTSTPDTLLSTNIINETEGEDLITTTLLTTVTQEDATINENDTLTTDTTNDNDNLLDSAFKKVDRLSDQIRQILQHYQKAGVVALPGKKLLPDPLPMSDLKNNFGFGQTMAFTNMSVFGLNNFTIEHVNTDVDKLQVYLLLHMKRLVILGNYTLRSFFRQSAGPFNVTLVDVDSEGAAELQPDEDGQLQASESRMNMYTRTMKMNFKNLGSTFLSSFMDSAGIFLFDSMKPAILEKVNMVLRTDFNKKLKSVTSKLTSSISPVDIALAEGRRYCRNKGYDPYHVKNFQSNQGLFVVKITDFLLVGMSRFYRVGNLSLSMDSGLIQIGVHVATGQLNGTCEWGVSIGGFEKGGNSSFTVEYLQVRALVNQSLDLRKHPQLDDLDIGLGKVNLKMVNEGPIELIIAKVVNTLPKLIRHIIVDAVEKPLKDKVQEILNDIDVREIVEERLPALDGLGL